MTRTWPIHLVAGLLGCGLAVLLAPALRGFLSPWSAIDGDRITMFASDACKTSRKALATVQADPRLSALIVPVPADGPEHESPQICAAALKILGDDHARVRWIPAALACRWLTEDASAVLPGRGVPTPSWYAAGTFYVDSTGAEEARLFAERGWRIEWTPAGLRLSPLDEPPPAMEPVADKPITRIEQLGMSSYRDDRW